MSDLSEKFRDGEGKQTDISESSINQLGASGNIEAHDITQITYNLRGPTSIHVDSEDQSRQLRCNLDEPSSSRADDAIVRDLSRRLKEWYSDLQLPLVSWMNEDDFPLDEYYIPLQLNSVRRATRNEDAANARLRKTNEIGGQSNVSLSLNPVNLQSNIDYRKRAINLMEIFDAVDGVSPKRILIEAQPGFGKTTLAHKIILDWRMGENYAKQFDFALLIPLRNLRDRTLRDVVFEILNQKDSEKVWNLISSDRTLLVLDGLDEVGDSAREKILKMLFDKTGSNMTIVVTCRTGLFKLNESERDSMFTGVAKRNYFWDKKFEILGFDDESRERFLEKFVEHKNYDKFEQIITEMVEYDMLQSPLILILLLFISEDDETFAIKTQTELYKILVDCIIKRSVSKNEKVKLGENFTIFDNQNITDYALYFCKFGELSFDHILNDNLQFECSDFLDLIYQMGFLIKHETVKNKFKLLHKYEAYHLTFLEFSAAFSLWDQFKKNGNEFPPEAIDQINCICFKKSSVSMVLPFLCGLMSDDVKKLFDQLLDFHFIYSKRVELILSFLCECVLSDDVCKIIAQFIPKDITYLLYKTLYLKNENLTKCIASLGVCCTDLWLLAESCVLQIESICVCLDRYSSEDVRVKRYFKNQVSCKYLFINVCNEIDSYQEIADQLCLLLHGVVNNYKLLHIGAFHPSSSYTLINDCVSNGILKNQTIAYLSCELTSREFTAGTVINIIKNNPVKKLELYLDFLNGFDNLCKIIPIIASSPDILSFELINRRGYSDCSLVNDRSPTFVRGLKREMPLIDLSNFLNGGKYWRHVGLQFINSICSGSLYNSECIDSIEILSPFPDSDVEILRALKPRKLRCDYELFDRLVLEPNLLLWGGLKSVTKLILQIWKQNGILERLSHVDKFINLKEVTLFLMEPLSPEKQREIVKCLPLFTVDQLQFCCEGFSSAADLFSGINDLIKKRELKSIGSIDFELEDRFLDITEHLNFFYTIKVILLNDFNVTVHFINSGHSILFQIDGMFESSRFNKQYFPRMSLSAGLRVYPDWFQRYDNVLKIQKK